MCERLWTLDLPQLLWIWKLNVRNTARPCVYISTVPPSVSVSLTSLHSHCVWFNLGLCKDPGLTCQVLDCNKEHTCGRYVIHAGVLYNHAWHAGVTRFPVNLPCPSFQLIVTPLCWYLQSLAESLKSWCQYMLGLGLIWHSHRGFLAHVFSTLYLHAQLGMFRSPNGDQQITAKSSTVHKLSCVRCNMLNMACGITGFLLSALDQWQFAAGFKVHALLWKSLRSAPGCEANFTKWPNCSITSCDAQRPKHYLSQAYMKEGAVKCWIHFLCWHNFEMTYVVQFGSVEELPHRLFNTYSSQDGAKLEAVHHHMLVHRASSQREIFTDSHWGGKGWFHSY